MVIPNLAMEPVVKRRLESAEPKCAYSRHRLQHNSTVPNGSPSPTLSSLSRDLQFRILDSYLAEDISAASPTVRYLRLAAASKTLQAACSTYITQPEKEESRKRMIDEVLGSAAPGPSSIRCARSHLRHWRHISGLVQDCFPKIAPWLTEFPPISIAVGEIRRLPLGEIFCLPLPDGWDGRLNSKFGTDDASNELRKFFEWIANKPCQVDVEIRVFCVQGLDENEPLFQLQGQKWRGEIKIHTNCEAADSLGSLVSHFANQPDWYGSMEAGSGRAERYLIFASSDRPPSPDNAFQGPRRGSANNVDHEAWPTPSSPPCERRLIFDSWALNQDTPLPLRSIKWIGSHEKIYWNRLEPSKLQDVTIVAPRVEDSLYRPDPDYPLRSIPMQYRQFGPGQADFDALARCHSLRNLVLRLGKIRLHEIGNLLQNNPHLVTLSLLSLNQDHWTDSTSAALWQSIGRMSRLKQLNLLELGALPSAYHLHAALENLPQLTHLRIQMSSQPYPGSSTWLAAIAPTLAKHPKLELIELHAPSLDDLISAFKRHPRKGGGQTEVYRYNRQDSLLMSRAAQES